MQFGSVILARLVGLGENNRLIVCSETTILSKSVSTAQTASRTRASCKIYLSNTQTLTSITDRYADDEMLGILGHTCVQLRLPVTSLWHSSPGISTAYYIGLAL